MEHIVEAIFVFLENNLWVVALISLTGFAGMIWSRNQLKGLKAAEFVADGGQYMRAPEEHVNAAIDEAEKEGDKKEFLNLLRQIRREHGHDSVRIGHLYWIWHKLKNKEYQVEKTPSFYNAEFEEDVSRVGVFDALLEKLEREPEDTRQRIGQAVIERRKQREKELNKSPLSTDEILAVFNEVLGEYGVSPIAHADREAVQERGKQQERTQ